MKTPAASLPSFLVAASAPAKPSTPASPKLHFVVIGKGGGTHQRQTEAAEARLVNPRDFAASSLNTKLAIEPIRL